MIHEKTNQTIAHCMQLLYKYTKEIDIYINDLEHDILIPISQLLDFEHQYLPHTLELEHFIDLPCSNEPLQNMLEKVYKRFLKKSYQFHLLIDKYMFTQTEEKNDYP